MDSRLDKNGLISDINVTPFVDVMLVLLIIFMVTAPMMVHGLKADLPKADSGTLPSEKEHIIVTIDKDSHIFINSFEVNLGFLKEKLIKVLENHSSKNVYLIADKSIAYGTVVLVMAQIKGAGVYSIGLVTDSTKNDKS